MEEGTTKDSRPRRNCVKSPITESDEVDHSDSSDFESKSSKKAKMEKRKKRTRKIDTRSSRDPDFFTQNFSSSTPATGSQETPDDDGYGIATDKKQGRQSRPTTKVGLENLGETCYLNSILQCLASVFDIRTTSNFNLPRSTLLKELLLCFGSINGESDEQFSPVAILDAVKERFPLRQQHDAHELLRFIIQLLKEEDPTNMTLNELN
ncbi:ubiquitin carboxyl-terminal hydrolase 1-like [Folsomia candida]|uniref:ubiquitin carboxyl-terminal hydrolase 1-like n=1 Tax=Folsomia candida TaxID=158441 RepID=UPI001604C3EE|nr:ubiquitin carboxyl-terminal hydrolase 1-like [Folsomia candida]